MTFKFDSIEVRDEETFVIFKKHGTTLGLGDNFRAAADEKPALMQEFDAHSFIARDRVDQVSDIQWGIAADALIRHRMERDEQFDSTVYEDALSDRQINLLRKGRVVEALQLDHA